MGTEFARSSCAMHERAPFSRRLRAPRDDMRLERTPLTRRQSVIDSPLGISLHLEPESANFEAAFRDLLPDIDLNTLIELPPEESSQENPDRDNFESRQAQQVLYLARDETRESRSSAPEQMLPLQVDGLDCAERTLTGLSDGATALSIKPWGNGYLAYIDRRIITWAWMMFMALGFNRRNVNRAITDNMPPELGMDTNGFNYGQTIFLAPILAAELPSRPVSKKVGPER
ncbi:hypothetical protein B2J93_8010 [Marssonina coronariae]|uniref:Uncharacterized protein n=1 Tax=Diplocarpon coronariae TaxID=2795749 RepID=A0A218ZB73_9HELO|nr:hypothetical protein B2J93_8010 [Marssonina coronariae]